MAVATNIKVNVDALDDNSNILSTAFVDKEIDNDTIHTFEVELDEDGNVICKHVGGRPKPPKTR